jgi:hypothetical protein
MRPCSIPLSLRSGFFRPGGPCGLAALLFMLFTAAAPALRADGIVLPQVAAPAVTMPDQRALLVWYEKEQTETLVIESRFVGQGRDFAWVVPLPSKPEITPATRGTLPTLEALFRPALAPRWGFAPVAAVLLIPLALLYLGYGAQSFSRGLLVTLICVVLAGITFPTVGSIGAGVGGPMVTGVSVERSTVGDYDVAVLSGESAGGITQWLRENKFALPTAAEPVVAEHARAGGFFAAVRLRRAQDAAEPTAPAPLVFTFKTPHPVYPMKLTGSGATGPLEVELFVFGDAQAEADGLRMMACAPVAGYESREARGIERPDPTGALTLSHPALRELCKSTTVGTRLRGILSPAEMTRDLTIRWQPFSGPVGMMKISEAEAWWRSWLAATGVLVGAAIFAAWRWWGEAPPWQFTAKALLAATALGGAVWLLLPSVPTTFGSFRHGRLRELYSDPFSRAVRELRPAERTEARVREKFHQALAETKYLPSPLPREGDAPGEYSFSQLPDGAWRLVWIAENGQEVFVPDMDEKPGAAR